MARWRPVDTRLWNDREFRSCSPDAQLLWLFLLTCPSNLIPGVIVCGLAGLSEQIGWTSKRFLERFAELSAKGLKVHADWSARLVWLENALKYEPPKNPNQLKGWSVQWDEIPDCDVKNSIWRALRSKSERWSELFSKQFREPFTKRLPEPLPQPSEEPLPKGLANQKQMQEQDQGEPSDCSGSGSESTAKKPHPDWGRKAAAASFRVWSAHCDRHGALFPNARPLLKLETALGFRELRERADDYAPLGDAGLVQFEQDAMHVLDVQEADARARQDPRYFGDGMWRATPFAQAKAFNVPRVERTATFTFGGGLPIAPEYRDEEDVA